MSPVDTGAPSVMTGSSKSAAEGKAQKAPNRTTKSEKQGGRGRADAGRRDKGQSRQPSAGNATLTKEAPSTAIFSKIDAESNKKLIDSSQASSASSSQQVFPNSKTQMNQGIVEVIISYRMMKCLFY